MSIAKKPIQVGAATFGDGRLAVIAGPCVIESAEHAMMMAREAMIPNQLSRMPGGGIWNQRAIRSARCPRGAGGPHTRNRTVPVASEVT